VDEESASRLTFISITLLGIDQEMSGCWEKMVHFLHACAIRSNEKEQFSLFLKCVAFSLRDHQELVMEEGEWPPFDRYDLLMKKRELLEALISFAYLYRFSEEVLRLLLLGEGNFDLLFKKLETIQRADEEDRDALGGGFLAVQEKYPDDYAKIGDVALCDQEALLLGRLAALGIEFFRDCIFHDFIRGHMKGKNRGVEERVALYEVVKEGSPELKRALFSHLKRALDSPTRAALIVEFDTGEEDSKIAASLLLNCPDEQVDQVRRILLLSLLIRGNLEELRDTHNEISRSPRLARLTIPGFEDIEAKLAEENDLSTLEEALNHIRYWPMAGNSVAHVVRRLREVDQAKKEHFFQLCHRAKEEGYTPNRELLAKLRASQIPGLFVEALITLFDKSVIKASTANT
jgi:hypothetical protein